MNKQMQTQRGNRFLEDIFAQPATLHEVLDDILDRQSAALDSAALLFASADRVIMTSMGSAFHSLMPMKRALDAIHPNVKVVETSELDQQLPRPGDLHVIMSRSGESKEIAALSRRLRADGQPLLAITMTPDSTLANNATATIADVASYDGFICTKAYTSLTLVGLLLASRLGGQLSEALASSLRRSFDWMADNSEMLLAVASEVPWTGQPATFLSKGIGRATASAGSLWLQESARVRASSENADDFFHGPVEQVDGDFTGVWIDLTPTEESRKQRAYLENLGAKLWGVVIDEGQPGDAIIPDKGVPESYRAIPAAMPVQFFAYAAARTRNLEPGVMRYMGWVVKDE